VVIVATQLKDLIKESVREAEAGGDMISYSPRTTSLSVARAQTQRDAAEERFFKALDSEVHSLWRFINNPGVAAVCLLRLINFPAGGASNAVSLNAHFNLPG
jgi:hypothetical protein